MLGQTIIVLITGITLAAMVCWNDFVRVEETDERDDEIQFGVNLPPNGKVQNSGQWPSDKCFGKGGDTSRFVHVAQSRESPIKSVVFSATAEKSEIVTADHQATFELEGTGKNFTDESVAARSAGQIVPPSANQALAERVAQAIRKGNFHGYDIDIETRSGVVTLSGIIGTEKQRLAAEEISSLVDGVSQVVNKLTATAESESTEKSSKHKAASIGDADGVFLSSLDAMLETAAVGNKEGGVSLAEMRLLVRLLAGQVEALETVLKTPDEYSAFVLFNGAGVAFIEKRLEDSAFLLYAGQLRMRFDQMCFPPTGTGGDDPFLAIVLISHALGSAINPAVMAEPKAFQKAIDRLEKWSPKAPEEYTPGYEFKARLSEKDAHEAAKPNRTEFLSRMGDLATLMNNAEYFSAFRVIQKYNLADDEKAPDNKEEREKASETMKQIEKDIGLKGIQSE